MQWHQETNMHFALSHQSNSLSNHCVFHRQTCWWPTQPLLGIAHTPDVFFRQSRQCPAGAGRLARSRISAAKSNLDVPAVTSVEGRILTVHYLRRNEDVQVRPSEGLCVDVRSQRQERQYLRHTCHAQQSWSLFLDNKCHYRVTSTDSRLIVPQDWRLHTWGEVAHPTTEFSHLKPDK